MGNLFSEIISRPILNLTVFFYQTIGFRDLGLAIIGITIFIRLLLLPLSLRAARSQKALAELAPQIDVIKEKHKGNTTAQSEAVMALYREKKVNPLAGCLPLLLQFPILFGMYQVFLNIFKPETLNQLYSFIPHPNSVNTIFLGLIDVSAANHLLAILAGVFQFFQAKLAIATQPQTPQTAALNTQMVYFLPIMIIVIGWSLPAGLALYWCTTTLFSIGEQLYLRRR